jgi:hypothetical protein
MKQMGRNYQKPCDKKHLTKEEAEELLARFIADPNNTCDKKRLRMYLCMGCSAKEAKCVWHLGHIRVNGKIRQRQVDGTWIMVEAQ